MLIAHNQDVTNKTNNHKTEKKTAYFSRDVPDYLFLECSFKFQMYKEWVNKLKSPIYYNWDCNKVSLT